MSPENHHIYEFGPFRLDARKRRLLLAGEIVSLTPKAIDTLVMLVEHQGKLVEREELMNTVWHDTFVEDSNLSVTVSMLRKALGQGAEGEGSKYIETVPRLGYRFVADVREVAGEGPVIAVEKRTQGQIVIEETAADSNGRAIVPGAKELTSRGAKWLTTRKIAAVLVCGIAVAVAALLVRNAIRTGSTAPSIRSIAVLPLRHFGQEPDDKDLRLRITDSLITKFGALRTVVVRPTSSVLRYADNKQDAIAVGRELKVDAVLDGTIQNEGKHLRVTLQLINVSNGNQLWSGQFDGQADQLLALQDKISSHAVQNLPFSLSDSERKQFGKRTTDSAEAYEAYLKGRYFWHKRTEAGLKKGIEYFQNSVEHDPTYALAYAGLADSYIMMANWRFMPSGDAYEKARAAARRALELDSQLAEAKTSLAYTTLLYQWDWNGAEQAFREAIALNPNYASAHHFYSICLLTAGRQAEALAEIQRAQELDPLSLIITSVHGWIHYEGRQFDQATDYFRKTLEMDSQYVPALLDLGACYLRRGDNQKAMELFEKARAAGGDTSRTLADMAQAYALSGEKSSALKILNQLEQSSNSRFVSPWDLSFVYADLGDKTRAMQLLEKAADEKVGWVISLGVEPGFDSLRAEPRFQRLKERVGIPVPKG